jgi:hypothetical protein
MSVTRSTSASQSADDAPRTVEAILRLERRVARLERLLDEAVGTFLNAKFPYGKPIDRWRRAR